MKKTKEKIINKKTKEKIISKKAKYIICGQNVKLLDNPLNLNFNSIANPGIKLAIQGEFNSTIYGKFYKVLNNKYISAQDDIIIKG